MGYKEISTTQTHQNSKHQSSKDHDPISYIMRAYKSTLLLLIQGSKGAGICMAMLPCNSISIHWEDAFSKGFVSAPVIFSGEMETFLYSKYAEFQ